MTITDAMTGQRIRSVAHRDALLCFFMESGKSVTTDFMYGEPRLIKDGDLVDGTHHHEGISNILAGRRVLAVGKEPDGINVVCQDGHEVEISWFGGIPTLKKVSVVVKLDPNRLFGAARRL